MKRNTIFAVLLCCILLAGCGQTENPYRVDTVVRIPVDPTDAPTAASTEEMETVMTVETEASAETEDPTEATEPAEPTEGKTESTGKKPASAKNSSSSTKKPTSNPKQESTEPPKATEPAPTEPPATEPETQPPTEAAESEVPTEATYDPSDYSIGSLERAILDEMNAYRAEAGLGELSMSSRLSGIAALRAEESLEVWSHTRPDGRSYTTAMSDYGYGFGTSAENLVHVGGSGDAAAIVAKWMDTDSKNNILNENFTTVGIGVYRCSGVTIAAVLLVG